MRLHKKIERILKLKVVTRGEWGPDTPPGFDEWFRDVVEEFVGDPVVDFVTAEYGLNAEDLLADMTIRGIVTYEPRATGDEWEVAYAGFSPQYNRITLEIYEGIFRNDDRADVINALIHELDHAARETAGLLTITPPKTNATPSEEIWSTVDETEKAAFKAQILELLSAGYTDQEIIAYMADVLSSGGDQPLEYGYGRVAWWAEQTVGRLLREVKSEYGDVYETA